MGEEGSGLPISTLFISLGFLSVAIILMVYHCILVRWCERQNALDQLPLPLPRLLPQEEETRSDQESSFIQLIPTYKYGKEVGKSCEGDNTCAVCLSEFKKGDDVRRLPECLHFFHVPCIDMWLYSHSSCPLCRTEMALSPVVATTPTAPPYLGGGMPRIGG